MTRVNPVRGLGETFSDGVVAAAMIDRLVRQCSQPSEVTLVMCRAARDYPAAGHVAPNEDAHPADRPLVSETETAIALERSSHAAANPHNAIA